jgi:hypothetical protein
MFLKVWQVTGDQPKRAAALDLKLPADQMSDFIRSIPTSRLFWHIDFASSRIYLAASNSV